MGIALEILLRSLLQNRLRGADQHDLIRRVRPGDLRYAGIQRGDRCVGHERGGPVPLN